MAPISSTSNTPITVAPTVRTQTERPATVSKSELVSQQEQQPQRADDVQERQDSEQARSVADIPASPSVTQTDKATSGEQQELEVAQQQAERADFNQQAGASREEQPNEVRPSSESEQSTNAPVALPQKENPAIQIFDELQNINASARQGQTLNQFA